MKLSDVRGRRQDENRGAPRRTRRRSRKDDYEEEDDVYQDDIDEEDDEYVDEGDMSKKLRKKRCWLGLFIKLLLVFS
ncbi:MAG: hypothetical protein ACSLEN_06440, partial [Candidatus Malihini olakiniferum]